MNDFVVTTIITSRGRFALRTTPAPYQGAPVLVLVHGWPESSYCWQAVSEQLQQDFQVIAPDLRGLGDSERTLDSAAYTKQAMGQDLLELLDTLAIKRCFLAGHDWGGAVAQEAALAQPGRFEKLILLNIHVLPNARGNAKAQAAMRNRPAPLWYQFFQNAYSDDGVGLAEAMIPGNERAWLGHFLRTWSAAGFPADALEEYARCYAITDTPTTGANMYRCFKQDMARWGQLAGRKFVMPGLYIHGYKDPVIIPEYTQHLDDVFDSIRVERIEAAHFVQEEQPQQVAGLLRDFITNT